MTKKEATIATCSYSPYCLTGSYVNPLALFPVPVLPSTLPSLLQNKNNSRFIPSTHWMKPSKFSRENRRVKKIKMTITRQTRFTEKLKNDYRNFPDYVALGSKIALFQIFHLLYTPKIKQLSQQFRLIYRNLISQPGFIDHYRLQYHHTK